MWEDFSVKKESYLRKIYNYIHPCPGIILEDESLDRNYQGVSYVLDDTVITDYSFEDMKKTDWSSDSKEEDGDEQYQPHGIEKKGDKVSNDLGSYSWYRQKKKHIHWIFQDDEIRTTPYSRARSKPSMNNVSATEWNSIPALQILFKFDEIKR